jgi:Spy/CpxP family protein refolding chaperone
MKDKKILKFAEDNPFFAFVVILFLFVTFFGLPAEAQKTFSPHNKGSLKIEDHGAFWHSPSLGLTEAQIKELENIKDAFIAEATPLSNKLKTLNLEMRYFISDPNAKPQTLFDRQRKIYEIRAKLESLLVSSQIKARCILTKEQFGRLPRGCPLGMGTIYETKIGIDRGLQKGIRY